MLYTLQFGNYTFPNQSFIVESFPLEKNITENTVPRTDGTTIPRAYIKGRTFNITGRLYQDDPDGGLTDLLAMQSALFAGENKFYYRSDRYINAQVKTCTPKYPAGTNYNMMEVDIEMEAADPFFYSAGASISNVISAVGQTFSFNINNLGNVFSEPKIYIVPSGATMSDNMRLINNSDNGSYFRYRGIVGIGQTILLDSTQFDFIVNGVDGLSNFEGDFVSLVAGSNSFVYAGQTATITVEHKNRWYN